MNCICQTLHLFCKHGLYPCTCTFCRVKAAPRRYTSSYGRTTAAQLSAIVNLAKAKQRSLPANISSWSVSFASSYIKFLIELPFPREYLPRLVAFDKEHTTGSDVYKATHKAGKSEFYWGDGMTRPVTQAIEQGDSQDLVDGVVTEVSND